MGIDRTLSLAQPQRARRPKRYLLGRLVVGVIRGIAFLLLRVRTEGLERLPQSGPVLLIGNHVNFVDPVLAYIVQRRYIKGMTAVEIYRHPFFHFLAWSVDAIPVKRGTPDLSAIRACIEALDAGWALYVAPEGTRSHHGKLQKAHAGVALILMRAGTQIPIYPIAYLGLEEFWPNLKQLRRTSVRVVVGQPFYLSLPQRHARQAEREQIVGEMMGQIAALLPPESRGVYADQVGVPPQYLRLANRGDRPLSSPGDGSRIPAHAYRGGQHKERQGIPDTE